MSVIARIEVPAEEFVLGDALEAYDGVTVHLESMVPTGNATIPYFWVDRGNTEVMQRALEENPVVESVRVVDETDQEALLRVDWSSEINGLIEVITATSGVVLEGSGMGDRWQFRVRFPDYDELFTFYRQCVDNGIPLDISRVHNPTEPTRTTDYGLSEAQERALLTALELGYFDVPREITLVGLAEELGISDSAVSQRIRRGLGSLLRQTIGDDRYEETEADSNAPDG